MLDQFQAAQGPWPEEEESWQNNESADPAELSFFISNTQTTIHNPHSTTQPQPNPLFQMDIKYHPEESKSWNFQ